MGEKGVNRLVVNGKEAGMGWGRIYPFEMRGYMLKGGGRRVEKGFLVEGVRWVIKVLVPICFTWH